MEMGRKETKTKYRATTSSVFFLLMRLQLTLIIFETHFSDLEILALDNNETAPI